MRSLKKYRVHYHFANGGDILRVVEAEDKERALSIAINSSSNDIIFTNSEGTLYCFFYRDVIYVSVTEDMVGIVEM